LTTGAEFQALFHRGRRIDRPSLLVLCREVGHGRRVGFAVSRQINRAVDRNRVRRRLRAAYRAARSAAPDSVDLVVIGKRRALGAEFGALVGDLRGAFAAIAAPEAAARTPR
jgi:ribonuclease P protein component